MTVPEVIVPLDFRDRADALAMVDLLGGACDIYKVGLELYTSGGPDVVRELRGRGKRVFLDLKLHDIPKTVAGAVSAARSMGADYLTVHAGGGPSMLSAARESAGDELKLLAVTLLTHLDAAALETLDLGDGAERIRRWALMASECGCAGAVCSPLEVAALRRELPRTFVLVTPGIRPAALSNDDQRRTAEPRAALDAGADLLVVGRPLTSAADPEAALGQLARSIMGGQLR